MNKIIIFCLFALSMFLTNCQKEVRSDSLSGLHITFKVDSTKTYDAKGISKNIFIFSPLGQKDKIWTINTANPHELDLITGKWMPLSKKFGYVLKRQIRNEYIWKDTYTGEVYISCLRDGLIRYYPSKDTFDFLKIHWVTAFYPRKKNIVLGTGSGLYFLDRNKNKASIAEKFPLNIWINSIQESGKDTLIINHKYFYHPVTNSFGEKDFKKPIPKKRANNNRVMSNIISKLPVIPGGYHEFQYDSIKWYYGKAKLFYSKNDSIFYEFPLFPRKSPRYMMADSVYLYVLFNDRFVIFNKGYIFDNSVVYNVSNYKQVSKELMKKMEKLYEGNMTFIELVAYALSIYNDKKYKKYPELQNTLNNIPRNFEYFVGNTGKSNLDSILDNDTIPNIFKFNILKGLCRKYTITAKLDSALIYFNLIKKLFPSYKDDCIDYTYTCVKKAFHSLDSIRKENVSKDRLLFVEAKIREKMINCSCWFGESYLDYSLVQEKYQELLNKYPESEYADDAEYWLIRQQYFDYEGTGYSLEGIPKIKKFVHKYPNSKYVPELLIDIAYTYGEVYSDYIDDMIKNKEKAIGELKDILNNYQLDSLQLERVNNIIKRFENEKIKLIFTLTIEPVKSVYKINEDIEVEVVLSNNSSTPRTLKLYKNGSYFTFGIHPDNNVRFIPADNVDTIKEDIEITWSKPLRQRIVLNKLARHWNGGKPGRFSFEKEGYYNLTCFSRENKLGSKQVKIYIKK